MGRRGPLTAGESRALVGMVTGIDDMDKVHAFALIVVTECPDCAGQKTITTTDLKHRDLITLLFNTITEIGAGEDHAH